MLKLAYLMRLCRKLKTKKDDQISIKRKQENE